METLNRVSSEIKQEESEKLTAEQKAHQETLDRLASELAEKEERTAEDLLALLSKG